MWYLSDVLVHTCSPDLIIGTDYVDGFAEFSRTKYCLIGPEALVLCAVWRLVSTGCHTKTVTQDERMGWIEQIQMRVECWWQREVFFGLGLCKGIHRVSVVRNGQAGTGREAAACKKLTSDEKDIQDARS